jgi:hypothetical protein
MKGNKNTVRVEHQEYPNQAVAKKLFPDGHLVVPNEAKNV